MAFHFPTWITARLDWLSSPAGDRAAGGVGMSERILVVEDQPGNRQIICDMLALPILRSWKLRTAKSTRGYRKGARDC
jgi:hypothetical protein